MAIVRISKEFHFEMAHALHHYDGHCKYLHGHSYRLLVTIKGEADNNPDSNNFGMLMDFSDLKKIVQEHIISKYDHTTVLSEHSVNEGILASKPLFDRLIITNYQPTCENLVVEFAETIKRLLPSHLSLAIVELFETSTASASWHASDN